MTDKKSNETGRRSGGGDRPPRRRVPAAPKAAKAADRGKSAAAPRAEKAFEGERIAKVMARAGACSRRDAEAWIAEGRVAVNGTALTSPAVNVREGDRIEVDGKPLAAREPTRLFLFHKPVGLVTTSKDPEGRDTVFAFLERRYPDLPRLVSVGRLDINTEGLLLLTNDGGLARTLELPATGWTRRYRVRAHGEIDQAQLDELERGVTVEGVDYAPIDARLDRIQGANAWISMSLREGKNREIKRVLEHLGLDVNRLIRVSFGPFQLGELGEGEIEEVRLKTMREQLGKGLAELAGVDFSSPSREPAAPEHVLAEEARQRAKTRTRKHVSVLREERDNRGEKAPRARIERGATSDRKGRAVAVEKIVVARRKEEPATTRNARHFRAERDARDDAAPRARREAGPFEETSPRSRGRVSEPRERGRGEFRGARPAGDESGTRRSAPGKRPFGENAERRGPKVAAAGEAGHRPRSRVGEQREERDRGEFRASRPTRRDGEARPRKFEGDDRRRAPRFDAAPGDAGQRSRARALERSGEKPRGEFRASRPPRRDGEGRPPRRDGEARPQAAGKRPYGAREERPREFEGEGRGRPRAGAAAGKSAPRARSGAGEQRDERSRGEFRGRPPREGGEARTRAPAKRPYAASGEGRGKFERDDRRPRKAGGDARSDARPRGPRTPSDASPRGAGKPGGPRKPGGAPRKPRGPR